MPTQAGLDKLDFPFTDTKVFYTEKNPTHNDLSCTAKIKYTIVKVYIT